MNRRVDILQRAKQDVASCYAFLADRSPQGAAEWFNRFTETRDLLANDAERHASTPQFQGLTYEIRQVGFKTRRGRTYCVLFTIRKDTVIVLRVRGPGQDSLSANDLPPTLADEDLNKS